MCGTKMLTLIVNHKLRLWSIQQWGIDCSQHFWNPACDASGLYSAVQFKVSSEEEGQYRWCSSPTGKYIQDTV